MHKDAFLVIPVTVTMHDKLTSDVNDKTMRTRVTYVVDRQFGVASHIIPDKHFYTRPIPSLSNNELTFRTDGTTVYNVCVTPDSDTRLFASQSGATYAILSEDDIYPMSVSKQGHGDARVPAICLRPDSFNDDKSGRGQQAYESSPTSTRHFSCDIILLDGTSVSGCRLFDGTTTKQDYIQANNLIPFDQVQSLPISPIVIEAIQTGVYGNYFYTWLTQVNKAYHGLFLDLANKHIVDVRIDAPHTYRLINRRITITRRHMYFAHSPMFEETVAQYEPNDRTSDSAIRTFLHKHIGDCKYITDVDPINSQEPQRTLSRAINADTYNIKSPKFKQIAPRKVHVQEEPTAMTLDVKVSRNICQS